MTETGCAATHVNKPTIGEEKMITYLHYVCHKRRITSFDLFGIAHEAMYGERGNIYDDHTVYDRYQIIPGYVLQYLEDVRNGIVPM